MTFFPQFLHTAIWYVNSPFRVYINWLLSWEGDYIYFGAIHHLEEKRNKMATSPDVIVSEIKVFSLLGPLLGIQLVCCMLK